MIWLLVATSVHLGFQLTITLVAYPALLDTPDAAWEAAHAAHGRRITPLVVAVYGALVITIPLALFTDPSPAVLVVALACGVAGLSTATVAAPTHGKLGEGLTTDLVRRLQVSDYVRTAAAFGAVVAAVVAVFTGSSG